MDLVEFCARLESIEPSSEGRALALLWYLDEKQAGIVVTAGVLARQLNEVGLGNPHSTRLNDALVRSGCVSYGPRGLSLKPLGRNTVRDRLKSILGTVAPAVDQDLGYLPQHVWVGTRGYIEKVCKQLNGTYQFGFYDAASVLVRRLIETLIIEAFEALKRESEIKDSQGHYQMLNALIGRVAAAPIGLGRGADKTFADVKELGDRSAHNRRYNAGKADLDKVASGVRVVTDELINIARLR